jgi:hypothetical protein
MEYVILINKICIKIFHFYSEANNEIQRVLKLQHMLPESWIIEVSIKRIQTKNKNEYL